MQKGQRGRVRSAIEDSRAVSCFFRSFAKSPYRKALIQITECCNLHCVHCFVSAVDSGDTMQVDAIEAAVIPRLKECRVSRVTLTGGEPFLHPDILTIVELLVEAGICVGICTNATTIRLAQMARLSDIGNVHINVSLDGFRPESHDSFRGDEGAFRRTVGAIEELSRHGLLQGLLVTPNSFAQIDEYAELCRFAMRVGASYVLMNPVSHMGRGVRSRTRVEAPREVMCKIREITTGFSHRLQVIHVRFPNHQLPLSSCGATSIFYIFANGDVAVCPYLVFAARTPTSKHEPSDFLVGNALQDLDISERLDDYDLHERYQVGSNPICTSCHLNSVCGKGCPAAIIASGQRIEGGDWEVCPIVDTSKERLPDG